MKKYILQLLRWLHILKKDTKLSKAQDRINKKIQEKRQEAFKKITDRPKKEEKEWDFIGGLFTCTIFISEQRRISRLITKYKLKYWDIDGNKILALNKKNAYRKYLNQND